MSIVVYKNLSQVLTLKEAHQKDGRRLEKEDLGKIKNATVVFDKEKILWVGKTDALPKLYAGEETFDLSYLI